MKRILSLLAFHLLLITSLCAQTSNVETVKAWTRTHVMGLPGGGLYDPTGTLADAQRLSAVQAVNGQASNIVAAADAGLADALARLYDAAARTNDFTGRLYVAADMDSDPGYDNVEGYVIRETVETNGVTAHYYVHYTRELDRAPETVWAFDLGNGAVGWAAGSAATNNATTNILGYACYDFAVERPAAARLVVLRTHRFLKFGAPEIPLRVASVRIVAGGVTNTPFTGSVVYTNSAASVTNEIIESYQSGFLQSVATNSIGGA